MSPLSPIADRACSNSCNTVPAGPAVTASHSRALGACSEKRVTVGTGASRRNAVATPQDATGPSTATSAHASRSRCHRRTAIGIGMPACGPPSATHCSCCFTSCAVWMRSSGSLARQAFTTRSRPGGVSGGAVAMDGGSAFS